MTYNPDNWVVNKIKGDMPKYELIQADCLEAMKEIAPGSVDLVLTDPPYGTTACKWDAVIPFEPMWGAVEENNKGKRCNRYDCKSAVYECVGYE
jgi:hypothetical protein